MKSITQIIRIVISASLLISLAAYITCLKVSSGLENNAKSVMPAEANWETAIEILNTRKVTEVVQSHNWEVTLRLEDGSQIKTLEPALDEILRQIERCGNVCREILIGTE